jgi:hypothetical protein
VTPTPERLHHLLTLHVIETGHAPDPNCLSILAGCSEPEAVAALRQLESMHGVILVPNSLKVWSLHPFALMPTAFWVATRTAGWWANCAWCSLGIAAALREDVMISTTAGAEDEPLEFRIENGRPSRQDLLMHFPEGPARWWDNPYCPCGNILFFASEAAIDHWCERHGNPKGSVLDMHAGVQLAQHWFGDYASPDWRRKTPGDAAAIFRELNLDPSFWLMPESFR